MATESISFRIDISSFDKEAFIELDKARATVRQMEEKIRVSFIKSDRLKAIQDISGTYDGGGKRSVIPRIVGNQIQADVLVDVPDQETAPKPYFNITEKTANLLLSGKLLNDDQKKALIKRMGFDLDALTK